MGPAQWTSTTASVTRCCRISFAATTRDEIAAFLRDELTGHFGLQPWLVTTNLIDRIFDWWESIK
jgi:hypothetical protein